MKDQHFLLLSIFPNGADLIGGNEILQTHGQFPFHEIKIIVFNASIKGDRFSAETSFEKGYA